MESNFPVVDMGLLQTEKRPEAMDKIKDACENWGFFEVKLYFTLIQDLEEIKKLTFLISELFFFLVVYYVIYQSL